jgi:hypothetical protein
MIQEDTRGSWPRWVNELDRLLVVRPQFVISGNLRDVYLTPTPEGLTFQPFLACLWERLALRGFAFFLTFDQVDGIRMYPETKGSIAGRLPGLELNEAGGTKVSLEKLPDWLRAVAVAKDVTCAFVVDYASRLVRHPQDLGDVEREFFAACEKLAHTTKPLRPPSHGGSPPFNPIIWLINRPNDLPDWFVVGNEGVRTLIAALPDRDTREKVAAKLAEGLSDYSQLTEGAQSKLIGQFADLTEGLTLRSLMAITALAREQGLPLAQIADAVRRYKVGLSDNPWKQSYLRDKLRHPEEVIGERVKGQEVAVRTALDILIRSVMGLSGAQASARGGRPRGVLFFAGPTGVGKTELAKAITQQIFGDEQAYKRFDMSEFSAEHSDARMIGAPPGYVGYDAGGELVNAIRERPFSVLLFDEIEKAHPRILDKFLQILEDGRLTDGRGETVFFSEAVIIFTSNLGMFEEKERFVAGEPGRQAVVRERVPVFNPKSPPPYDQLKEKVRKAIEDHFRFKLERPELLNRIGDNIVVFDFIQPPVARQIFDKMLDNVIARVREEHYVTLDIPVSIRETLLEWCTDDLSFGGRGIGNRLETTFINPLARALFGAPLDQHRALTVQHVVFKEGTYSVEFA